MKTILITGATDGIGLALAKAYHAQKARLLLVGRRPLSTLSDPLFTDETYCQVDLADKHCTAELSSWLHENSVSEVDLVIHNAAVGYVGALAAQPVDDLYNQLQINLWAPIALSHMLYPMAARARGKIVFVSSVATAFPGPDYAVYTATKVALEGFVRSWRVELAADQSPVRLQIVRPGATRTKMHAKSGADPLKMRAERFPSAEQVAGNIMRAVASEQSAATIGLANRLVHGLGTFSETLVDWGMQQLRRRTTSKSAVLSAQRSLDTHRDIDPQNQHAKRHCVITGAADGIGRALAETFANAGYVVTGIDVDMVRAEATKSAFTAAGLDVQFVHGDLSATDTLPQIITALASRPSIDLFIHNAGISAVGPFTDSNLARQRAVFDINLTAPLLLTALLLHQERIALGASFVFISSLSRFMSYPGAALYAATKDGLASYARSLAVAGVPQQHHVLTVFPGPTRTAHARRYSPDNRREAKRMPPERLARLIFAAIQARRRTLIPGIANQTAAIFGKLFPTFAEQMMRRTIYDRLPRQK